MKLRAAQYALTGALLVVGLGIMFYSVESGRWWIWAIYCACLPLLSLTYLAYHFLALPSGERMPTVRAHWRNFRDYMSGEHDPKT